MADETQLGELVRTCQRSAVHLEMRDAYMLDDARLIAWRAGHRPNPAVRAEWWNPWHDNMQEATHRGVDVRRARVVSEPVSEYIRYEYDVTFTNVAVGERVRWLSRRRTTDIPLPGNDFWLFDDETLLVNHFAGNGDWTDVELVTDIDTIKLCGAAFETVWERATPHEEYRPV